MKKILAIAVTAALMAPAFASAADVEFSGNARYRFATVDAGGTKTDKYDNRVRFGASVKNDGGVKVFVQGESDYDKSAANAANSVQVDQAYIEVPMGAVTVTAGDQKATWGAGFRVYDEKRSNRVKVTGKVGDWTLGGMIDDDGAANGGVAGGTTGDDMKNGTVFATGKVADWTVGVITTPRVEWTDVFATGAAGPVNVAFEHSTQDAAGGLTKTGTLLQLTMGFGSVTGILAMVNTTDGFAADNDFAPISTLGKTNNTAVADIGALGAFPAEDWGVTLVGVTGKVNTVSWTVLAGSASIDPSAGGAGLSVSVTDVAVVVPVAKGTDVKFTYGNLGDDADYTATGLYLTTKW